MSILTSASSSSVSRGYDYYKHNKVNNVKQLNDHEFEGYVEGSLKKPYYVKIDIKHPRKSHCDCPHANGNITCKHMTALYFELFPNEVDDYESWLNSDYDDYNDFNKEILNIREKKKIEELYKNKSLHLQIDKILLNEKLSVYSDYRWIAKFYKKNKSSEELYEFCKVLENYLDSLKHYSIKNLIPKSNVLIAIHLLNEFDINECTNLMLKNAKYLQYIDYIVENSNDVLNLYKSFMKLIEKNYFKNKMYIPDILYRFVSITNHENKDICINHYLYSYLCLGHTEYLDILGYYLTEAKIISAIENKTKDIFLLTKLYKFYDKKEKL